MPINYEFNEEEERFPLRIERLVGILNEIRFLDRQNWAVVNKTSIRSNGDELTPKGITHEFPQELIKAFTT